MKTNDLQLADILLFSGEKGDRISDAILFLTDSCVMHSALSYKKSGQIIEEIPDGVTINTLDMNSKRLKGRIVHVMRLKKQPQSMSPVLDIADKYFEQKAPYAKSNLYLIGMILLYKKFTPDIFGKIKHIIVKILGKLVADIIDSMNRGETPMVCSQFVYECYQEAGKEYHLSITNGCLINDSKLKSKNQSSLIDLMIKKTENMPSDSLLLDKTNEINLRIKSTPKKSDQELAQELLDAFQVTDKDALLNLKSVSDPEELDIELISAIHTLGQAIYQANILQNRELLPLTQAIHLENIGDTLKFLKEREAYFVTPGDLLTHCDDLEEIGILTN